MGEMINIAICDDSEIALKQLEKVLDAKKEKWNLTWDIYTSAENLFESEKQKKHEYDLFILDIIRSVMNGVELADVISVEDKKAFFMFVTDYEKFALPVLNDDLNLVGYIMKPITEEAMEKALAKYDVKRVQKNTTFRFGFKRNLHQVVCEDIIYIERKARYIKIVTDTETYKSYMDLNEAWEQLDRRYFASPHASYIANLRKVVTIRGKEILLKNGETINLTRTYREDFRNSYLEYLEVV